MKKIILSLILIISMFLIIGCDCKDMANYVAKSEYDNLLKKYNKLQAEHIKLKNDLEKYKSGFKSMYE